jgi:hypothetical protein
MRTGMSSTDSGVGVSLPTSCDGFPDSSETGLQRLLQLQAVLNHLIAHSNRALDAVTSLLIAPRKTTPEIRRQAAIIAAHHTDHLCTGSLELLKTPCGVDECDMDSKWKDTFNEFINISVESQGLNMKIQKKYERQEEERYKENAKNKSLSKTDFTHKLKKHFKSNGNLIIPSKKHKSDDCTNLERVSDMKGNISMEPMECSSSTCNDDGNGSEYSDSFVSAGCSKETHYRKDILTPEVFKPNTGQSEAILG